ncbi:hypothetical protein B0T16DRAFT_336291 [Cercophora newfieldiana]|uniref:PLL-like beta propeller domain-containing protein n=1 Tax=Cercophora newfieldiana TaxID=92897 RepID=A0AA39XUP2_9PEZI|nr:hypothetical protein B0T16DRAFT_336291 [Cercophora newfieldiana]
MLTTIFLLLTTASPLLALPGPSPHHKLSKRFLTEPRASHLDWNAPRPNSDFDFLSVNTSTLHSESYFNSPDRLSKRTSPNPNATPLIFSRATSGRWESLSGYTYKPAAPSYKGYHPAACSWGGKRMDVYYMSKEKTCQFKYRDYEHKEPKYQSWSSWEDLGGELDSPPAVCSRKKDNYHVFCKGTDGQAWHRSYDYGQYNGWGKWQSMGGKVGKYEPAACSWGKGHASVYVGASDGACWTRHYYEKDGKTGWEGWYNLGGYMASPPKVVTYGEEHASVYCKGEDGQAWHKKTDKKKESGWGEWESLGGSLDSSVAACAWEGRMDVYVKGSDGACWHKTYKEETWGAWENLGGDMKADTAPDVVVVDGGMEVYITGEDEKVYRKKWEDGSWTSDDWEPMGGKGIETGPVAVEWGDGEVDVYFTGKEGEVQRCF